MLHKLRDLLSALSLASQAIRATPTEEIPAQEYVDVIYDSAEEACVLCTELHTAWIGEGLKRKKQPIDLNEMIRRLKPLLEARAPPETELRIEYAEGLPLLIVNPSHMSAVLYDLFINATESLGNGPGRITIHTDYLNKGAEDLAGTPLLDGDGVPPSGVLVEIVETGIREGATLLPVGSQDSAASPDAYGPGVDAINKTVALLGGRLAIDSLVDGGTRTRCWFS
ncbi:sensory histidine kinase AtoS [Pseudobythopirellula maris]|uniref:Sensory histidine kinase AtoS n=1 Tax=Pseudobythopirellula maris TaxID=2527991 RepID=A0A5C5ZTK3_9BACT|nr:hypothetical protein [Pseudobythopirellula maris]TWT90348.1 sensory histidine kinase AtoS [Pseudobythopirellula maris]